MTCKIITISQGKGGAAKTTTAVNLAGALKELGYKVALCDWDVEKPDAVSWAAQGDSIDWVNKIDKEDPVKNIDELKMSHDVLVFDTPPNYESNAFKAVMASDYVIIPSSNNFLEQDNTKNAVSLPTLSGKPFKILMSKVKKGTKEGKEMLDQVISKDISFNVVITERNVVAQSPRYGVWVGEYAKNSDSHKQFVLLAQEVEVWAKLNKHNLKAESLFESEGVA